MPEVMELIDTHFKNAIKNMVRNLDKNMNIMKKQIRTFNREIGPIKLEILGVNNMLFKI